MIVVTREHLASFGTEAEFATAVHAFEEALAAHASTVDVPAPTTPSWLVDLVVRQFGGVYEIAPLPPDPEEPPEPEPPTFEELVAAKLDALSHKRFEVETAGVWLNGMMIRTDRETSSIITSAYVKAKNNPGYVVSNWKVANGVFVSLDAPTIFAIADAVSDHVQRSFDHEALLSSAILAAADADELAAVDIENGW